ncbi:MAG: hypothetical protein IH977_06410 [Nitrospinae bacterium]|nr:hypothetical protein [Nitrospinota bacterium]
MYTSAVSNGHVYFGSGGAIRVLRITDDTSWQEVATLTTSGVVRGLHASENYLYVADHSGALRIIDISTPETLKEIGQVTLPTAVRAVTVHGRYAYLAAGWSGLVVVDVSDPRHPRVAHAHKTPGIATDVHVTGSLALVANSQRASDSSMCPIPLSRERWDTTTWRATPMASLPRQSMPMSWASNGSLVMMWASRSLRSPIPRHPSARDFTRWCMEPSAFGLRTTWRIWPEWPTMPA